MLERAAGTAPAIVRASSLMPIKSMSMLEQVNEWIRSLPTPEHHGLHIGDIIKFETEGDLPPWIDPSREYHVHADAALDRRWRRSGKIMTDETGDVVANVYDDGRAIAEWSSNMKGSRSIVLR